MISRCERLVHLKPLLRSLTGRLVEVNGGSVRVRRPARGGVFREGVLQAVSFEESESLTYRDNVIVFKL